MRVTAVMGRDMVVMHGETLAPVRERVNMKGEMVVMKGEMVVIRGEMVIMKGEIDPS